MQAQACHVSQIARQWYALKPQTCAGGYDTEWSVPLLLTHLQDALSRPDNYIAVELVDNKVIAACGSSLVHTLSPPYPLLVTEWMWVGKGKPAARVWKECRTWGKRQGAVLASCALGRPQMNTRKFTETLQWRVL